jgi:outer membrane protein assembly factor BamB
MDRRSLTFIAIGLIIIILVSAFVIYEFGFPKSSVPSVGSSGVLWKRPLEDFATALAVDNEKVFILDRTTGVVSCYDSQSGRSIWNSSLPGGPFYVSGLVVSGGKIYAGAWDDNVVCLDEATGKVQWNFQGIWNTFQNHPVPPNSIIVQDNRVFCINDNAFSVHDSTTGKFLWQASSNNPYTVGNITDLKTWQVAGYVLGGDPFDGNYVYATGGNSSNWYFFKLNTDNGAVLWRSNITWDGIYLSYGVGSPPSAVAISQGQVIIEGANPQLFSLNSTSGQVLWSLNLGATIYNPVVFNNLLLFGASDGNFYALNLANGIIAWKTKVDTQNLFSFANSTNTPETSSIQIDSQNKQLFWNFEVQLNGASGNYTATLCSLDIATGNIKWTETSDNGTFFGSTTGLFNKDSIFLIGNNALYIFNESTGNLVQSLQFSHYILPPIAVGNETFVATDLWLIAYT